ncbi:UbiH/UbiF/VisC/COQ6 family ubiquinone biosynthesis hydroxylase [Pseudoblastomonas halimionae]|uniref:FAD-binding protein n=1 Tax=Alteriqipengyuania halimionae TaxID=1926630 RepID=A0A6I4U377_9SPHN|nr:UbiH/UbiF/VisC/COQ6 family ubiquinone biosynthesis hydroxylase [Alteriqipengyuania halimionae]MXP08657.1 FAD-binding protein [Alteriqipengyuania halimionae]
MSDRKDLLIIGGGLVGMTCALAAARKGISSHVVDRATAEELTAEGVDGRASAISTASWNMFVNIGLAERLEPLGCPIESIAVTDGMKPGRIDFRPEPHEGTLGRMYANRDLRIALFDAAREEDLIDWHSGAEVVDRHRDAFGASVTLADGRELTASLMVAAEGRRSPTREEAGLPIAHWQYDHAGVVTVLAHEKPHGGVAWEIFYPAGPFALLPLLDDEQGRHRSALVWTVDEKDAPGVRKLGKRAFEAEVEKRMHGIFGKVEEITERAAWPLGFQHGAQITDTRLTLIGDAAHGIHPIAGQGLNLGLRDAAALVEVISDGMRLGLEPGDEQLLARYERWRSLDAFSVSLATDGLTRLFGVPGKAASAIRRFGMGAVQRLPELKRWFMDEARGVSGDTPELLRD